MNVQVLKQLITQELKNNGTHLLRVLIGILEPREGNDYPRMAETPQGMLNCVGLQNKGWLSGIVQNEAMMSAEERMIYETFGGRDTIINNLMKQFDSDGDLLNANGVWVQAGTFL